MPLDDDVSCRLPVTDIDCWLCDGLLKWKDQGIAVQLGSPPTRPTRPGQARPWVPPLIQYIPLFYYDATGVHLRKTLGYYIPLASFTLREAWQCLDGNSNGDGATATAGSPTAIARIARWLLHSGQSPSHDRLRQRRRTVHC